MRLAVLRAAWVISVLGAVADGTARGAAGRAAGWLRVWLAGWLASGLAAEHTDINDLVVGVPHLAQRLGCAQRLDD